jgi:hypothetical protein
MSSPKHKQGVGKRSVTILESFKERGLRSDEHIATIRRVSFRQDRSLAGHKCAGIRIADRVALCNVDSSEAAPAIGVGEGDTGTPVSWIGFVMDVPDPDTFGETQNARILAQCA